MPKITFFVWEIANSYKIMLIFLKKIARIGENLQEKIQMRLPYYCLSLLPRFGAILISSAFVFDFLFAKQLACATACVLH